MRRTLTVVAIALFSVCASAAEPNVLSDAEKAAGWKLLFDGKTTTGWLALSGKVNEKAFPEKGWTVEDGALHHAKGGGGGDIVTEEVFEEFELVWEWKIGAGGNSGVKYNLPVATKGVGFEYQMLDDVKDTGRAGRLHLTAGLYDLIEPAADRVAKPAGEWNRSRIVVKGDHVEHWLNGGKTVEFEFKSEALKEAIAKSKFKDVAYFGVKVWSPILVQDHGDEVSVRDIKIRALPAK